MAKKATKLTPEIEAQANELLGQWDNAVKERAKFNALEKDLRDKLVELCFDPDIKEGTQNIDVGFGMNLNCQKTISRKVDEAALDGIMCDDTRELIDKVITYKPALSVSAWKLLTDDETKIFSDAVIERQGSSQLKLVRPKR